MIAIRVMASCCFSLSFFFKKEESKNLRACVFLSFGDEV